MAEPLTQVTPFQQLALDIHRAGPTNHFVKIRNVWELEGELDREALAAALLEVVRKHSMLRTAFRAVDGRDHQVVMPAPPHIELPIVDLTGVAEGDHRSRLELLCRDLASVAFALDGESLMRAVLVRLGPARHALVTVVHHIAFDAGSTRPFFEEMRRCYQSAAEPPAPAAAYVELAAELVAFRETDAGRAQLAYWTARLAGAEPLVLPLDAPREDLDARRAAAPRGIAVAQVAEIRKRVPAALSTELVAAAKQQRTTAFVLLLAAFAATLRRLTGQTDICVQSTNSLRSMPKFERTIGVVGNQLLLRVDASGTPTLRELARRSRDAVFAAWANGRVPVAEQAPPGLRRVNFNFIPASHNVFDTGAFAPGLSSRRLPMDSDPSRVQIPFDYNLWLLETPDGILLRMFYLPELVRAETVGGLLDQYIDRIGQLVTSPDATAS